MNKICPAVHIPKKTPKLINRYKLLCGIIYGGPLRVVFYQQMFIMGVMHTILFSLAGETILI